MPIEKQFTTRRMISYMFQKKLNTKLSRIGYKGLFLMVHYNITNFLSKVHFLSVYMVRLQMYTESRWMIA